jgi:hypothetical protein
VGYTTDYFNFTKSVNAYTDAGHVGYSTQFQGGLSLDLTVGLSHVKSQGAAAGYLGYNTSATLQKTVNANSLSLYYTQTSGDSSGLGTISDTSRGGLTWRHAARTAVLSLDSSVFDTRGTLGNSYNARGVAGALTVGVPISKTLSVQGGVQYQETAGTSGFGFSQKRVFFTLHYSEPNLWHLPW